MDRIFEEINKRILFSFHLPYKEEFVMLLDKLDFDEKDKVSKYFMDIEWNIGSTNILRILQECSILTATAYIIRQTDPEHVQLILNDFLETNFELLANLTKNSVYDVLNSAKLTSILEECFRRLITDLLSNENEINVAYISELKNLLNDECILSICLLHLNIILELEDSQIKTAFSNITEWFRNSSENANFNILLKEILTNRKEIIEQIFNKSLLPEFKGWKFFTIIFQVIAGECSPEEAVIFRKHLKDVFRLFLVKKESRIFLTLLITGRTLYYKAHSNLETYNTFFKNTIGNMTYVINADDFKAVMSALSSTIILERDNHFLEIQWNTAIPAPIHCNNIVLSYKIQCRQKLAEICAKNPGKDVKHSIIGTDDNSISNLANQGLNESIVIDDDD